MNCVHRQVNFATVIETDYLAWNQSKANAGSPWNISASNDLSLCHSAVIAPIGGREGGKGRAEREGTDSTWEREEGVHENGLSSTE